MGFGFEKPKLSENNAENRKNNNSILNTKTKRYYPVNNLLNKVKSKYIIGIIFNYMKKEKCYTIIQYNKKIQKKCNIDLDSYKNRYFNYQIEIELNIAEKIEKDENIFINYIKEDEPYIHIYLNDIPKEIKRNYLNEDEASSKIKIILDIKFSKFKKLFRDCKCIKKIKFTKFKRDDITDMSEMFSGCKVKEINLSNFNTDNVKNFNKMFSMCTNLSKLDLSKFNTNNLINAGYMFWQCWSLNKIDLSTFTGNKMIYLEKMFSGCSSLREINLQSFNTCNVINMHEMFYGCCSLTKLNLKNFKTNNVTNMDGMFGRCSCLKELDISNFNFEKVRNIENFFEFCSRLEYIIITELKDDIPTTIKNIFLKLKNHTNIIANNNNSI